MLELKLTTMLKQMRNVDVATCVTGRAPSAAGIAPLPRGTTSASAPSGVRPANEAPPAASAAELVWDLVQRRLTFRSLDVRDS